jgi:hypothetical protein
MAAPGKYEYEVIGPLEVGGVAPGGVVELGDDVNIDALIEAGHVKPVSSGKPKTEKPE